MTALLQKALNAAEKLSEPEQDWLGQRLLDDMEVSEKRWDEVVTHNADKADKLEAMILAEIGKGDFEPIEKLFAADLASAH
jgi:hypothetical protein